MVISKTFKIQVNKEKPRTPGEDYLGWALTIGPLDFSVGWWMRPNSFNFHLIDVRLHSCKQDVGVDFTVLGLTLSVKAMKIKAILKELDEGI